MFVSNQNKHGSLGPWTISKSAQTADLLNVNNNGETVKSSCARGEKHILIVMRAGLTVGYHPGLAVMKHLTRTSITDYLTFQMFPN